MYEKKKKRKKKKSKVLPHKGKILFETKRKFITFVALCESRH